MSAFNKYANLSSASHWSKDVGSNQISGHCSISIFVLSLFNKHLSVITASEVARSAVIMCLNVVLNCNFIILFYEITTETSSVTHFINSVFHDDCVLNDSVIKIKKKTENEDSFSVHSEPSILSLNFFPIDLKASAAHLSRFLLSKSHLHESSEKSVLCFMCEIWKLLPPPPNELEWSVQM